MMRRIALGTALLLGLTFGCDPSGREDGTTRATDPSESESQPAKPEADREAAAEQDDDGVDHASVATEEPERRPPAYGHIEPELPPPSPDALTVHALAGYVVVTVYARPDIDSRHMGYIRLGTRMMVTPAIEGPGCPKGFHGLPEGGFACASKGLLVDAKQPPYMPNPPPPPRQAHALPYDYAFVRRWNTPMWWRVPSQEEQRVAEEQRLEREAIREGEPLPGEAPEATATDGSTGADAMLAAADGDESSLPSLDDESEPLAAEPTEDIAADPTEEAATTPTEETQEEPIKLPLSPETPWLERGFFLSLAEKIEERGRTWWRTARGAIVETRGTYRYHTKDFEGALLDEREYPFGFVMVDEAKVFELGENDRLQRVKKLGRRTFVDLREETEIRGKTYMLTEDGLLIRKEALRLPDLQPMPEGLKSWERWIDVSIGKQMLVAYEGNEPVYLTLVSTGKKGTEDEPFETPTGRWRIRSKHISSTMDGNTASDGNYSIQDVPWAMFFEGSYALHGAFWHRGFGYRRSHGCINLGPTDARWLFYWTTPYLPEDWHGVHATERAPGTTVVVRE